MKRDTFLFSIRLIGNYNRKFLIMLQSVLWFIGLTIFFSLVGGVSYGLVEFGIYLSNR